MAESSYFLVDFGSQTWQTRKFLSNEVVNENISHMSYKYGICPLPFLISGRSILGPLMGVGRGIVVAILLRILVIFTQH